MARNSRPLQSQARQSDASRGAQLYDHAHGLEAWRRYRISTTLNHAHHNRNQRPVSSQSRHNHHDSERDFDAHARLGDDFERFQNERQDFEEYEGEPHDQRVDRAWDERNVWQNHNARPDLQRFLDSRLIRDLEYPAGRRRSVQRQEQPYSNDNHHQDPEPFRNTRRLGRSNVHEFDRRRPQAYPIDDWYNQPHHEEQYDAVQYVSRRSDYERRRTDYIEVEEDGFIDVDERYGGRP